MQSALVFDRNALREITDGDEAIEKQLITLFSQTTERCLSILASLAAQDEAQQWPVILHELKGAAANIRADALAILCKQHELLPMDKIRRTAALGDLKKSCDALNLQLTSLLTGQ